MGKPIILTGLRANNDLHIGNYLGALLPLVDMAKTHAGEFQVNLFVPDLHSFTTPIDHSQLYEQIIQNLRIFAAAGLPLDDDNIHIYRQSYIPAHSELTWILDCFTGVGEMQRMTQHKDKANKIAMQVIESLRKEAGYNEYFKDSDIEQKINSRVEKSIGMGLLNYPVLMAADILLYNASYVPVGEDQTQHLEFTRDIAERLNKQFGDLFVVPKPVKEQHAFFGKDQGLRIRDLQDPTKKMSKSDETGKGVIFLSDTPATARKKIMGATTDSQGRIAYNRAEQPGLANLLDLHALFSGKTIGEVCKQYVGQEQYGPLKSALADELATFLERFQAKLKAVDDTALLAKLKKDEATMNKQANETLLRVQKAVGLRK